MRQSGRSGAAAAELGFHQSLPPHVRTVGGDGHVGRKQADDADRCVGGGGRRGGGFQSPGPGGRHDDGGQRLVWDHFTMTYNWFIASLL